MAQRSQLRLVCAYHRTVSSMSCHSFPLFLLLLCFMFTVVMVMGPSDALKEANAFTQGSPANQEKSPFPLTLIPGDYNHNNNHSMLFNLSNWVDSLVAANANLSRTNSSSVNDSITEDVNSSSFVVIGNCDAIWDGIYKWPSSPGNTTVSIDCTDIFALTMGFVDQSAENPIKHFAQRRCLITGQWGWNNWTNYTECLNVLAQQEKDHSKVNKVQEIVSYVVLILLIASLISLILSILIFMSFKPLQCLRIRVHKNLCLALLLNCCLYIIMNSLVGIHRLDLSVVADWFCKLLKCMNVYSSMATINWMFVEGFLFHRRLHAPFHQNTRIYTFGYYFVGWILPAICVLTWALCLEFVSVVAHKPCWEGYRTSNTIFIVSTPMIVAVGVNFIFLISIIRLLVTKLRADRSKSDQATIKAIKATALLIPLLGIHHLVVMYNPSTFNRKLVNVYIVINVLFQSVQGIIVSVLYCFTNNEVRSVLNSAWSRRRLSHNFLGGHHSMSSNGHGNSLLGKRRRQSIGTHSFNLLLNNNSKNGNNATNNNNNNNNGPVKEQPSGKYLQVARITPPELPPLPPPSPLPSANGSMRRVSPWEPSKVPGSPTVATTMVYGPTSDHKPETDSQSSITIGSNSSGSGITANGNNNKLTVPSMARNANSFPASFPQANITDL